MTNAADVDSVDANDANDTAGSYAGPGADDTADEQMSIWAD